MDLSIKNVTLFLTSVSTVILVSLLLKWLNSSKKTSSNDNNDNDSNKDFMDAISSRPPTKTTSNSGTSNSVEQAPPKIEEVDYSDQEIPDRTITMQELAEHTGTADAVWIGINGLVYDVTSRREMYSPGSGYSVFAATDATRCLAKSSLNVQDMEPLGSLEGLTEKELTTLKEWEVYYRKRYLIVGRMTK